MTRDPRIERAAMRTYAHSGVCIVCGAEFSRRTKNDRKPITCSRKCSSVRAAQTRPPERKTLERRFWEKVTKTDSCWLWTARLTKGYGSLRHNGKNYYAHRVSWLLHHGADPGELLVLHTCDNPKCVRPDHLFLGDHAANTLDMNVKLRNGRMKLVPEQVREIRRLAAEGSMTKLEIAKMFGMSHSQTVAITLGQSWSYLE